ncbi:MAG: ABC transporter substrate-binding protein [Leptolyngbya sp. Prado105]|jgi:NitT/TauT family transport system substrate-binding protein|nr:ABC transporter substrate-binding protein [Leptolyngbya sp. Prado105]
MNFKRHKQGKRRLTSLKLTIRRGLSRGILAFIAAAFMVSSIVGCLHEPVKPIRVGYLVWPGYESLFLANDLGYYQGAGIRLVDYPSGSETIRAFRNGDLEAATLTLYEALLVAETLPNFRIVLVMDSSNGADVLLSKPTIQGLENLKNQRIGVESGAVGAYVLTRALEKVALTPKDVQVISLGVSEHEQAFKRENVDAVVTFEPTRSKLLEVGAKQLFDSTQIPGEILDILAIREDVLMQQPKTVEALIAGNFRAWKYLEKHPADAAQRIAPREGVTPEQFLESLKGIYIPDLEQNRRLLGNQDAANRERMNRVAQFMADSKLLSRKIDPVALFDDRFVRRVQATAIAP